MVTDDPSVAETEAAAGHRVVLVVPVGGRSGGAEPGRIALLVGDFADPAVRAVADEMEAELYGR